MVKNYFALLVLLISIAALFRDDFSFTLLYLFAGVFALGTWWSRRSLSQIEFKRSYTNRAFLGEEIKITLKIKNLSWLPIPWIRIHEGLPVELSGPDSFQIVSSFGSRSEDTFEYRVDARQRGYFPIGPIFFRSSDILGLSSSELLRKGDAEFLTVYPKIIPFAHITFPSQSPLGTLRYHQPIFEDPTRVTGKRDYTPGDSMRRVDWKSTASTGRMQVKQFEPSIALETVIFLNLNAEDYYYLTRIASTELAITIAASVANWVISKNQTVGLLANGKDKLSSGENPGYIPARSGKSHLMRILDLLARIQVGDFPNFSELLRNRRVHLPWGTTLTIITGFVDDLLLNELYQCRRGGLDVNLILAGTVPTGREIIRKAGLFGIPIIKITRERDMDFWRR
jgi:uncharacterized protein (DUF58 family)